MPDPLLFTPDTAQRFFDAAAEEAIPPGALLSAPELGLGWNPRLAPILTLLQ